MQRSAPALVLAAVALAMAVWTWGTWGDVQVDYGGEVYAAWRVSQGEVLYRDVAYFTGPLSPWVNALWFRLFGVGIWTLHAANLLLVALDLWLVYALLRRCADRFAATLGGVLFLVLFAFGRFEGLNNSNYVAPYSHEVVHATPLALGALLALARWRERGRARWLALAGACFGLACLTKAEYTLALGAAALLALFLGRARAREWGSFALAAAVPMLLAWLALLAPLGPREALGGVLGAWRHVFDERITELRFYRYVTGLDQPGANLLLLVEIAALELAVLGACWFAARRLPRAGARAAWCAGIALGPLLFWLLPLRPTTWLELARPWPLFASVAALAAVWQAWRARADRHATEALEQRLVLRAACALFAAALLAKMLLNARVQMYGFALALPATLLVALLVVETIPRALAARGGSFVLARALGCGVLAAFVLGHLRVMQACQRVPTVAVGEGRDELRADARGPVVSAVLRELGAKLRPGERFLVLPEGIMLNYLARVPAPARYINYMPPELLMFGEEAMVADLRAARPAAIVLLHKPTHEYGFPWFGVDYARVFAAWIMQEYVTGPLFGDEPLRNGSRFGARILWHKDRGGR